MTQLGHTIQNGIHFLVFPSNVRQEEYEEIFTRAYKLLWNLSGIRLIVDLSPLDYINSGFIGIIAELFASVEEGGGRMNIVANNALKDAFYLVGFHDFVDIVLSREEALWLLK